MKIQITHKAVIRLDLNNVKEVNAAITFLAQYAGRVISLESISPSKNESYFVKLIKEVRFLTDKRDGKYVSLKATKEFVQNLRDSGDRAHQKKLCHDWIMAHGAPMNLLEHLEECLILKSFPNVPS